MRRRSHLCFLDNLEGGRLWGQTPNPLGVRAGFGCRYTRLSRQLRFFGDGLEGVAIEARPARISNAPSEEEAGCGEELHGAGAISEDAGGFGGSAPAGQGASF